MVAQSPGDASSGSGLRGPLVGLATAAVYFVAAKGGLLLALEGAPVTTVWPPTGIALAAVVLLGSPWVWRGIALGAFLANLTANAPVATAAVIAIGNTLEAVAGARLLARAGFRPSLERLRDALALIIFAAGTSTMVSATIGVVGLAAGGVQPWTSFGRLWWAWWVGDALGALVVAPLLMVWSSPQPELSPRERRLEAVALVATTLLVGVAGFGMGREVPLAVYPLHYLTFPLVIWAALRFGQRGTATVTFLVSTIAITSTVGGSGPFALATRHESLLLLQMFMSVAAVTGLVLGAAITERDVTRRQRARDYQDLHMSEERLRLALDAGRMGVWDWNVLTGKVEWSENLEAIHGLAPGTFSGDLAGFQAPVHPDDRTRVQEAIDSALEAGVEYDAEFRNLRSDGSVGWISTKGLVLRDDAGRAVRMLGISMDVTEPRRLAEELRARASELALADRRKDEFLAMLSHELRNPLSALVTSLYLLRREGRGRERLLELAERQTGQLTSLVDDLLDVSRITQGKIVLRPEPVQLGDVVMQVLETTGPTMELRKQQLRLVLPDEPTIVHGDPTRLAQIVSNLLDNAGKYTPVGGAIALEVERQGSSVCLRVRDTGAGLAADLLPNVFDLFVQGDRSLARTHGGLGIGLTIVRRLVELHGGRIEARSPGPGQGSEFVVELPAIDVMPLEVAGTQPAAPPIGDVKVKVLVVEDNQDAAEALAALVELWGHDVRVALDAEAALEIATRWQPHAIVSDIGLPGLDGFELARRLGRGRSDAVLIALSGYGRDEDKQAALDAGFDHHLVKPPDLARLAELLVQVALDLHDDSASSA